MSKCNVVQLKRPLNNSFNRVLVAQLQRNRKSIRERVDRKEGNWNNTLMGVMFVEIEGFLIGKAFKVFNLRPKFSIVATLPSLLPCYDHIVCCCLTRTELLRDPPSTSPISNIKIILKITLTRSHRSKCFSNWSLVQRVNWVSRESMWSLVGLGKRAVTIGSWYWKLVSVLMQRLVTKNIVHCLLIFGRRRSSDDFHQLSSNDGLTGTVE